jgi:hypothetical protein
VVLFLAAALLSGCQTDKHYSQTELTALQSREFDAPYESTYTAVVNALFDAGYIVRSSDKDAGFIAAYRASGDAWAGMVSQSAQIKIDAAGRRTSVRVSTTDGAGQQRVNKKQIDELLNLIDRRLVGDLTTPSPAAQAPALHQNRVEGPGR